MVAWGGLLLRDTCFLAVVMDLKKGSQGGSGVPWLVNLTFLLCQVPKVHLTEQPK